MAKFLRIVGIEKYQHYKDRNPPWVKLHCDILNSYTWTVLDDASRLLAVVCIVLASRTENKIPLDREYLMLQGRFLKRPDVRPLVEVGFAEVVEEPELALPRPEMLADASKLRTNVRPETETETEIKTKKRASRLPEDFIPQAEHYEIAKELALNADMEFQKFRDHFLGSGGVKLDWNATFRNWLRNAVNYRGHNGRSNPNQPQRVSAQVARWHNNRAELERAFAATVGGPAGQNSDGQAPRLSSGDGRLLEGQVKKLP